MAAAGDPISLMIDGQAVITDSQFSCTNPRSKTNLWKYCSASAEHAVEAATAAQNAFPEWSQKNVRARAAVLHRAADLMIERRASLKHVVKAETAADDEFISFQVDATITQLRDLAARATMIHGSFPSVEAEGRSGLVLKEPYGVVLGIAPWNAPIILGTRAFAAPLVTGNTVVLKGSEMAPKTFLSLVNIFHDAGLPKACLNLIFAAPAHAAEVTTALISHRAISKINFTGSTAVGRIIATTAGKHLKPVLMELGGKASAIVFEDANLEQAAKATLVGGLLHSGQVCMATERVLVHSSIVDKFITVLEQELAGMSTTAIGEPALISPVADSRFRELISDATEKGAIVLNKGPSSTTTNKQDDRNVALRPVILTGLTSDMSLYHTESFGPVLTLHTFNTEEDALRLANDTEYGLAGAIFTQDLGLALRVAKRYTTGAVHVNAMSIHDEAILPHGGVKGSGWGRFNANEGIDEWLRTKVVTWQD